MESSTLELAEVLEEYGDERGDVFGGFVSGGLHVVSEEKVISKTASHVPKLPMFGV